MKVQINKRGAWRDIAEFEAARAAAAKSAVQRFARALGTRDSFRITADGRSALEYCEPPRFVWRKA